MHTSFPNHFTKYWDFKTPNSVLQQYTATYIGERLHAVPGRERDRKGAGPSDVNPAGELLLTVVLGGRLIKGRT